MLMSERRAYAAAAAIAAAEFERISFERRRDADEFIAAMPPFER